MALSQQIARVAYTVGMFSWVADPRYWLGTRPNLSIDRPIFLMGLQGGGLTLLTRMLRRQGQVLTGSGSKQWWSGPDEIQNIFGPVLPAEFSGMRWKVPPHPLFGKPRSWSFGSGTLYPEYRRTEEHLTQSLKITLRSIIGYALARHGRGIVEPRFIDKSQTFMLRAGLIHAALADTDPRFVLVPRNPYVSVWRAASGKARDMADVMDHTTMSERLEICAEHYANCMSAVLEDAERSRFNLHILRFEALLANPETELKRLCNALELNYHPDMIPSASHAMPFASRFKDRWYPLKPEVNNAYFSQMPQEAFDIVNAACADLTSQLGYQLRQGPQETSDDT